MAMARARDCCVRFTPPVDVRNEPMKVPSLKFQRCRTAVPSPKIPKRLMRPEMVDSKWERTTTPAERKANLPFCDELDTDVENALIRGELLHLLVLPGECRRPTDVEARKASRQGQPTG